MPRRLFGSRWFRLLDRTDGPAGVRRPQAARRRAARRHSDWLACDVAPAEVLESRTLLSASTFASHTVVDQSSGASRADGASAVVAVDVEGDGHVDLVSASFNDDKIVWYANVNGDGSQWVTHVVTTSADGAVSVAAGDLDGDGDRDLVSASWNDDTIAWYENGGGADPTFTRHVIATDADGARSVAIADVDGDGRLDILSASVGNDTVAWYANGGGAAPTFTKHLVATDADQAFAVSVGDVDKDGDLDVLSASRGDDTIAWYENTAGDGSTFVKHVVTTLADGASSVAVADLDHDGKVDFVSASTFDDTIAWYQGTTSNGTSFTRRVISNRADGAFAIAIADLDGDGDLDVLSASSLDDKVAWYESSGGTNPVFTEHRISLTADAAQSLVVADINDDGDLDVASASFNDDKIAWHENDPATSNVLPIADIVDVTPDPRSVSVGLVTTTFSEPVTGVDLGDFRLTRDGAPISLAGVPFVAIGSMQYTLDLTSVAKNSGVYELRLTSAGSNIKDSAGGALIADATDSWTIQFAVPTMTAPAGTIIGNKPTFAWTPAVGATSYELKVDNLTTGTTDVIRRSGLAGTTFTTTAALAPGAYRGTVRAVNGGAPGSFSVPLDFTIVAPVLTADVLDVSPDPRTTSVGPVTVTFSDAVTGVDINDFVLTRDGLGVGLSGLAVIQVQPTQYTIDLSSVTAAGGTYELRLVASGSGIASADTTLLLDAFDQWTNVFQTPVLNGPSGTVTTRTPTIIWSAAAGAVQYELKVDNLSTGALDVIRAGGLAGTAFTPVAPLADGAFRATIRAFNAASDASPWSVPLDFNVRTSLPLADIVDVSPDPRATPAGLVKIVFSEDVVGVDVGDFRLTLNGNAVSLAGAPFLMLSATEYRLDLSGSTSALGAYELRLVAAGSGIQGDIGQPLGADAVDTWVTVPNVAPTILPIADQTISRGQASLSVALQGTDPNHDALTYAARVFPANPLSDAAWQLDRQLGLSIDDGFIENDYYANARGVGEKYLRGNGGAWYLLFANGDLRLWRTSLADSALVATLDRSFYDDPRLLWDATDVTAGVATTIAGENLSIAPPAGYTGVFGVEVTVSDGALSNQWTFTVRVTNAPAALGEIADATIGHRGVGRIDLPASDADGDPLTFRASTLDTNPAYALDRQLGLFIDETFVPNNYYLNARGAGEKYLMGANGAWFLIYADGSVVEWHTSLAESRLIAKLDPTVYADPALLWNARPGTGDRVRLQLSGGTLTVDPDDDFIGTARVQVEVSDGLTTATRQFNVLVANRPPVLAPISNRTLTGSQPVQITLSALDADGDGLSFQAQALGRDPAYALAHELGLYIDDGFVEQDYYRNARGVGEKYLRGRGDGWFLLFADGRLYRWGTSLSDMTLVATIDGSYFDDPSRLWDAKGSAADRVEVAVDGNVLSIVPEQGLTGSFEIAVSASDGLASSTRTFRVSI